MDIISKRHERIWIGCGESGFWQNVIYENFPHYCATCSMQGHSEEKCGLKKKSQLIVKGKQGTRTKMWKEIASAEARVEEQQEGMGKRKETEQGIMQMVSSSQKVQEEVGQSSGSNGKEDMGKTNSEGHGNSYNNKNSAEKEEEVNQRLMCMNAAGNVQGDNVDDRLHNSNAGDKGVEEIINAVPTSNRFGTLSAENVELVCEVIVNETDESEGEATEEIANSIEQADGAGNIEGKTGAEAGNNVLEEIIGDTSGTVKEVEDGANERGERENQCPLSALQGEEGAVVWQTVNTMENRLEGIMRNSVFFNPFPGNPSEEVGPKSREEGEEPQEKKRGRKKGKKVDYRETVSQSSRILRKNHREEGRSRSDEEFIGVEH